jgi:hydrogenase maturation protease
VRTLEQRSKHVSLRREAAPDQVAPRARMLVLGLGNDILTDDAIGLLVSRRLRIELVNHPGIEVRETPEMGLSLLDHLAGYAQAVIIDSIQTGNAPPGTVHELNAASLAQLTGRTPHFVGLGEALALGRRLGLEMPGEVSLFAVEVSDPFTLGVRLSPQLEEAFPAILERIRRGILGVAMSHSESPQPGSESPALP